MSNTRLDQVQLDFIAAVQKQGLPQVLQQIGAWFDQTAKATVEDQLDAFMGELAGNPEARELQLLDVMLSSAESLTNHSTSWGTNMYRQAVIGAQAKLLNISSGGKCDRTARRERWAALLAKETPSAVNGMTPEPVLKV